MKKWLVSSADAEKVRKITAATDLSPLLAEVMVTRGYDTTDRLVEFFNGSELSDPFLMLDMDKAVDSITEAIESGERICIFGDYDCDGITSTAVMYDYLLNMGADVTYMIPEREDGYGLSIEAVERMHADGVTLIITVDNGISAVEESKRIAELGMQLVITDHHQPSDTLPDAVAIVDPHRAGCLSTFKDLCGAGVALKLCAALDGGSYDIVCEQYLALVAIATVADVVPLVGENRVIVSQGLRMIENTENVGLLKLMEKCGFKPDNITSSNIAFGIAPRINAASRFGSAVTALKMLISEDESAEGYVDELISLNSQRRSVESGIMESVFAQIDGDPALRHSRVLVVSGNNWHRGIIGIVAARLVDIFHKPAVVLSVDDNGVASGSARSISGFNVFKCFDHCRDLLIKCGGHELAGGLTVSEDNIPALREMIEAYAKKTCPVMPKMTVTADKLLRGADITYDNAVSLRRIQPCGDKNPEPIFALSGAVITAIYPLSNGDHTKLLVSYDGVNVQVLMFRVKTADFAFKVGDRIDLMANMQADEYNGSKRVSLLALDFRRHGIVQDRYFAARDVYELFRRGEDTPKNLLARGVPTRDEMITVYNRIKEGGGSCTYDELYSVLQTPEMNAFKLQVAIDAFCDTGLLTYSASTGRVTIVPPTQKVNIMESETLIKLRSLI